LIRIQYPDSSVVEGVGFIEAKRTYPEKGEDSKNLFNEFKVCQLKRIYKYAPHAYLSLYDHRPIDIRAFNSSSILDPFILRLLLDDFLWFYGRLNEPRIAVLPINNAINFYKRTQRKNREMYIYADLLSHHIVTKYFLGKDLHFSKEIINIAKGYESELIELRHKYLIVASISYGSSESSPEAIDVNQNIFRQIAIE
jgi:hypothetical protein